MFLIKEFIMGFTVIEIHNKWVAKYLNEDGVQKQITFGPSDDDYKNAQKFVQEQRDLYKKNKEKTPSQVIQDQQPKEPPSQLKMEPPNDHELVTFQQLCEEYLQHITINSRSLNHITSMKKVAEGIFYPQLGANTPIADIDYAKHILPFFTWLKTTSSPSTGEVRSVVTINKYGDFLKIFFNYAVQRGYIDKNPMVLWKKEFVPKKTKELDVEDIQKIMDNSPEHLAWAIEVAFNTGARTGISELLSLKWKDVDFDKGQIHIYATKTRQHRWVTVSDHFLCRLRQKMAESRCEYIISYHGKPVRRLNKSFNAACKKAGIACMYDIRHRFASELIKANVAVGDVSRAIGHFIVSTTTDVYLEVLPKEMMNIKDKLPQLNVKHGPAEDEAEILG